MGIDSTLLPDKLLRLMPKEERAKLGKAGRTSDDIAKAIAHKSEREMQDQIRRFLELRKWWYAWQRMDKRTRGKKGQPDFVTCVPFTRGISSHGLFVAIECKMPGGALRPEQITAQEQIVATYGEHLIATSAQQAIDWLISLSRE